MKDYLDLTKEQKNAISRAKRAMKALSDSGLVVIMQDGSAHIHYQENYDYCNEHGNIDCGFTGLTDEKGEQISNLARLTNIIH